METQIVKNKTVKKHRIFGSLFLCVSLTLLILNLLLGVQSEIGEFNVQSLTNDAIYSNYRYTFLESIFDFDKFLGDFWSSLIFSMFTVGYLLIYRHSDSSIPFDILEKQGKSHRWCYRTFFLLSILLVVLAILGSILNWGLARPYLEGETFNLLLGNFYPERTTEMLLPWLVIGSGFILLLYLPIKGFKRKNWEIQSDGIKYLVIAFGIIENFIVIFPINPIFFINGNTIYELIYVLIQTFSIVGIILLIESSSYQNSNMNSTTTLEYPRNPRLFKHFLLYLLLFLGFFVFIGVYMILYTPYSEIGLFRLLQSLLSWLFRIFLSIGLWSYTQYHSTQKQIRCVNPNNKEGSN